MTGLLAVAATSEEEEGCMSSMAEALDPVSGKEEDCVCISARLFKLWSSTEEED